MTSKEALLDIQKRNEALKKEGHFHIDTVTISVIEKLVERDTPKSTIKNTNHRFTEHYCGVCFCSLDIPQLREVNFCPKCGQRIMWAKENDK